RAVDLTVAKLGRKAGRCRTLWTPLDGGDVPDFAALVRQVESRAGGALAPAGAERLAHNHGSDFDRIFQLAEGSPELLGEIGSSGVLRAEVIYAIRSEMAHRLADVVFRRTDLGTGGDPGEAALVECAGIVARECGWSAERTREELGEVRARFGHAPMGFRAPRRN
ncbi:MAG: glycerol-3-phosphate dehydrogenase C-terminal domain-containing protein, partial [Gemmatimonadales bacterium]